MTDMKKNIKRTAVLSVVLVLMFAMTAFGADGTEEYVPAVYATFWALVPPVVAIGLALITKEVYSSLFVGVLMGGILYSGFSFEGTITHIIEDGMISVLSDSYNVGILIFLVILGTMVCLMNRAGGSADAQYTLGKERDPLGIETGRRGAGLCGASLDISGFIRYDWRTDLLASPAWTAGCVVPFWGGCADAWQGDCHG